MFISRDRLTDLLRNVVESIDIPDKVYEDATLKYEDIGEWLSQEDSELRIHSPQIYPQGSFRFGTVIQPVSPTCEYDIDLVCLLNIKKESTTQENIKRLVGNRLKRRKDLAAVLHEGRRCWTLDYARQFHLDVLPSIPNEEKPRTGILLSDRNLRNWQKSNPIAYADWFYSRMNVIFEERRVLAARDLGVSVAEVPHWAVKTPLQRTVQLLKRHRDISFQGNPENQPISIIITTLAAQAYRNQRDVLTATTDIVDDIRRDLTSTYPKMIQRRNGVWWIQNPVDEEENFADKWNEYPDRQEAFAQWLQRVITDLKSAENSISLHDAAGKLGSIFGQHSARIAINGRVEPSSVANAMAVPSASEILHRKPPAWPLQPIFTATITATAHIKKGGKKLWPITNRELPKRLWLKFVLETNAPSPFSIEWQVVNTGNEAAAANGLRGDFYDGDGDTDNTRWESTEYRGTHWIEGFVIKEGTCVARTGRKYVRVR